jgi:eukaryotic-like serine/threonine-protein kinase
MPFVTPLGPDDPRRVGRYRLSGRIADYPADLGPTNSYVARLPDGSMASVALLGKDWAAGGAARDRFTAEARAARRVAPFCAARVLDAGFDGDEPYLVSEFVEGPSLTEAVGAEGSFAEADLAALAVGTATGLTAVHQAGLVHGDFGPDHVVLGAEGPRIVHFSITPPYGSATPSADMLAWAQTIMFAAAGRPAIGPQDLNFLPELLRNTVAACLAPDPASRPPARGVVTALLGRSDPAAGLLAEGTRQARAAARGFPHASPGRATEEFPAITRSSATARRVGWVSACVACVAAIAAASTFIFMHHQGSGSNALRSTSDNRAASSAKEASPSPSITATIPAALAGAWSGEVHQTDPVVQVTVTITLAGGSSAGTISYAELKCSGRLQLLSAAAGKLTLDEAISTGQQSCTGGVVTLTQQANGTLTFSFSRSNGPSPTGVLTKRA